jgi:hypothetical protein
MTYPAYVREKARQLRAERRLSIDEIAERLALPKTTIYYWVGDPALARPRRENPHPGTRAMQRKFRHLREAAYEEGCRSFGALAAEDPTFRDFVCMYVGGAPSAIATMSRSATRTRELCCSRLGGFGRSPGIRFASRSSTTPTRTPPSCASSGAGRSIPLQRQSRSSEKATAANSGAEAGGRNTESSQCERATRNYGRACRGGWIVCRSSG